MYAPITAEPHANRTAALTLRPVIKWGVFSLWILLGFAFSLAQDSEPQVFQDAPAPLAPVRPRAERDQRRVASEAFYAHGRLLYDRRELKQALQRYQRAWRYNPDAETILPEIVSIAFALRRVDEAARYALLITDPRQSDSLLFKRLALEVSARRQWDTAVRLYEYSESTNGQLASEDSPDDIGSALLCMEMGRLYFLTGDYKKSAALFTRVREVLENPDELSKNKTLQKMVLGQPERTYQMLGESFLRAEDLDAAESMFRKQNEAKPDAARLSFQLARIAAKRGEAQQSLKRLDEFLKSQSGAAGVEPYDLLVEQILQSMDDEQEAEQLADKRLEELLEEDLQNATLTYFLASRALEEGRLDRAQQLYENLATIQPGAECYDGLIRIHCQRRDVDDLAMALANASARAGSLGPFAEALDTLTQDQELLQETLESLRQRIEEQPNQTVGGQALAAAWLAFRDQQYVEGTRLFQLAMEGLDPGVKPDAVSNWGIELLLAKQYKLAATVFQHAIEQKLAPDNQPLFYFYLIRSQALAEQYDEALKGAEKAAALFPGVPRLVALPGWVLYYAKRHEQAEQLLRQLLEQFDDKHDSDAVRDQMRDTRLMLSNLSVIQDRSPEAEEWLEQVLDEFPGDTGAMNDLGYLWTDQRKYLNWSLDMIERAVAAEPENTAYIDSLGWNYYQLGRYEEAVEQLETAAADEDPDGVVLEHLADAYAKLGQEKKALQTYRRARDAFRKTGDAEKEQATTIKIQQYEK